MLLREINSDKRGKIFLVEGELGHPELTIFTTKQGFARGGCIHRINTEYTTVVSGRVIYQIGETVLSLKTGESTYIPKSTPHYFVAMEDSVVLEWGATPEEKKEKHRGFRQIVESINDSADKADSDAQGSPSRIQVHE